ncbi:MurR/RpiR family transcriptional regulator [Spiroplasma endosymbiont of Aspidapion aeneum]|uniref:MurR/RpiR family transcriptional regulator n=1 Tax=Spiroplasma endosymbiont of Aspidapion aeneum TaxID=3066276 RepID=UPI00313BAB02
MKNIRTMEKIKILINKKTNQSYIDIASYLDNNIENIGSLSIKMIANSTFTSQATITRFSQELGLSGFKELKFKLLYELSQDKIDYSYEIEQKNDELLEILQKNIFYFRKIKNDIISISTIILEASNVYIYGFGGNVNIINIFKNYLIRMNINSIYLNDRDDQLAYSQNKKDNSIHILVSFKFRNEHWDKIFQNIQVSNGRKIIITTTKNEDKITTVKNDNDIIIQIPYNEGHKFGRDNSEVSFLLTLMLIIEHLFEKSNLDKKIKSQDIY